MDIVVKQSSISSSSEEMEDYADNDALQPWSSITELREKSPVPAVLPPDSQWRNVLYARQPFEDNYVDSAQFMKELRKNENVHNYKYTEVLVETFPLTQEIAIVVIFVYVFTQIHEGRYSAVGLLYVDCALIFIAWAVYVFRGLEADRKTLAAHERSGTPEVKSSVVTSNPTSNNTTTTTTTTMEERVSPVPSKPHHSSSSNSSRVAARRARRKHGVWYHYSEFGRQVIALVSILVLIIPILTSLVATFSDDTIIALTVFIMFLHTGLVDYKYLAGVSDHNRGSFAMNAAYFGVTLMASRMHGSLEGGSIIAFGALIFTLNPFPRRLVKQWSPRAEVALTLVLFVIGMYCLFSVPSIFVFFVGAIAMITFVIPFFFVKLHSRKDQISGPWDEAKPTNSAAAAEWANSV